MPVVGLHFADQGVRSIMEADDIWNLQISFSSKQKPNLLGAVAHDPQVQVAHNPQAAAGHNPRLEVAHNPRAAVAHNPWAEVAHNPWVEVAHSLLVVRE